MINATDLLGSLINSTMTKSGPGRIDHTLGNQGIGGQGGILGQILGGSGGAGGGQGDLLSTLTKMAGSMMGGSPQAGHARSGGTMPAPGGAPGGTDLLGQLSSAIFGGSGGSARGATGGGIMAVLGGLALDAFRKMNAGSPDSQGVTAQNIDADDLSRLIAGMRKPASREEEQQVQDIATLTLKAMINAAKADGRIDAEESRRIVGKLKEDGITDEEERFIVSEMQKPLDTDGIVRAVPNQQVGAQIYAASLLAIEVDTDAERRYMQDLASKLDLNSNVVRYIQTSVGMA